MMQSPQAPIVDQPADRAHELILRRIVERFEDSTGPDSVVPDEIVGSWRRSMGAGLQPERFEVPYLSPLDDVGLLVWAAGPVIDRIGEDLQETRTGLLLADHRARIIDRRAPDADVGRLLDRIELAPGFLYAEDRVGTNAIGTAVETSSPSVVRGLEHFANALSAVACSATPIRDPGTGRLLGVVDLTSAATDASALMAPLVRRAGWEIEQRLLDRVSVQDRVLYDHFLRARRSTHGAVAIVSAHRMLVNAAAARLLQESDRATLWDRLADSPGQEEEITLSDGRTIVAGVEAIVDGGRRIGAVIRVGGNPGRNPGAGPRGTSPPRTVHGWASLSETERTVAGLVAEGLTNREAAARIVLSPHTIDFHLRHIFGKLDVTSRVELTRVVLQHPDGAA